MLDAFFLPGDLREIIIYPLSPLPLELIKGEIIFGGYGTPSKLCQTEKYQSPPVESHLFSLPGEETFLPNDQYLVSTQVRRLGA